jgi:ribosome biogenesis GTPase
MEKGKIIKIISNHCTIDTGKEQVIAKPAGKLRKGSSPVVGDEVEFETVQDSHRIVKIHPRTNQLLRPAVANVDQALIVTSCKDPDFSEHLLNRLIFLVSLAQIEPVICITKFDLLGEKEQQELMHVMQKYEQAGYRLIYSYPGSNDEQLALLLKDKISVLCGQSGAGKSSLLNRLDPSFELRTQQISKALGRGKHTTRHCELHKVRQGLVADTPGFSSLDFSRLDLSHLDEVILDFKPYLNQCKFSDCKHVNEPDCAIKEALEQNKINPVLYEDYKYLVEEARKKPVYK